MDIKVGLTVNGQWIKADTIMLVSSSVNIYHCSFDFSQEWEPYTKTAVFCLNSGEPIEVPVNLDECVIPSEALQNPGILFIGVYGIATNDSGEVSERYPTVWTKQIRVTEGVPNGSQGNPPSQTQYEQFIADVKENADVAESSARSAISASDNAAMSASSANTYMVSAQNFATQSETSATSASSSASSARESATSAENSAEKAGQYVVQLPYIGDNGNWFLFDTNTGAYVDSGKKSTGSDGIAATIAVGTTTTGDAGTQASVVNSGTSNAAIFDFFIPRGEKGDKGDTGDPGVVVKYKQEFTSQTTVSINATTHGCGVDPVIDVWVLSGSNYVQTNGYQTDGYLLSCDVSGNVTVTFNTPTSGKIVIC